MTDQLQGAIDQFVQHLSVTKMDLVKKYCLENGLPFDEEKYYQDGRITSNKKDMLEFATILAKDFIDYEEPEEEQEAEVVESEPETVVEHADDEAMVAPVFPVFCHSDHLGHVVHLHGAIADQTDHGPIRMSKLRRDCVGHRRAHRGKSTGKRGHHSWTHLDITGIPIGAGTAVAGEDDLVGKA